MKNEAVLRTVIGPFFKRLAEFFTVVHAHPNNCCGEFAIPETGVRIPNVLELTYIRKDRLDTPRYPPLTPHPLDVSRNVPSKPPLFLGEEWLENGRPLESRIKMLEDRLDDQKLQSGGMTESELVLRSLHTITEKIAALARQPSEESSFRDVAAGRPYVLSSGFASSPATGSVHDAGKYFFHTGIGKNQFIKVDLGDFFEITRIQITNRIDMCFDRAKGLFAIFSESDRRDDESVFHIHTSDAFLSGEMKVCTVDIPTVRARFVTITSSHETALHFSDLKVFAAD